MKTLAFSFILFLSIFSYGGNMQQIEKMKYTFTNLRADNLSILDDFYAQDTLFLDPLGEHRGLDSVKSYYGNLYKNVTSIDFEYKDVISNGNDHVLVWIMKLKAKGLNGGETVVVHGNSVIKFNADNKVIYHRDYFDMGEFIYEKVPVLNFIISFIKDKLKSH